MNGDVRWILLDIWNSIEYLPGLQQKYHLHIFIIWEFTSKLCNLLLLRPPARVWPGWGWTWTEWSSMSGGDLCPVRGCLARSVDPPQGPRCPRSVRMTRGRGRSPRGHRGPGRPRGRATPRPRDSTPTTSRGWQETGRQKSSSLQVSHHYRYKYQYQCQVLLHYHYQCNVK